MSTESQRNLRLEEGLKAAAAYRNLSPRELNGFQELIVALADALEALRADHGSEIERLTALVASKQAKIDALMLEHCPEEMTEEQRAEWAKHQQPVRYGCHCDIETMPEGFEPDGCVLDTGKDDDCVYAPPLRRAGQGKESCQYWRPIAQPKTTRQAQVPVAQKASSATIEKLAELVQRLSRFAPPRPAMEATDYLKQHGLYVPTPRD